ncbi:hypothetical protein H1R20_g8523, partial [Candolleomyces eurysporus]
MKIQINFISKQKVQSATELTEQTDSEQPESEEASDVDTLDTFSAPAEIPDTLVPGSLGAQCNIPEAFQAGLGGDIPPALQTILCGANIPAAFSIPAIIPYTQAPDNTLGTRVDIPKPLGVLEP